MRQSVLGPANRTAGPHPFVGQVLSGGITLTRLIGYGKLGNVFEGTREGRSRGPKQLAVKVLRREFTRALVDAGFVDILRVMSDTQHPNLMPIEAVGQRDSGDLFFAMPLMTMRPPRSLAMIVEECGALAPERARKILVQIASALSAAHSSLVFHGDLKPSNIFVPTTSPRFGDYIVVGSFGLARIVPHVARRLTPAFEYRPPESADPLRDPYTTSAKALTDIYALGCIAVELLTGTPPLLGSNPQATINERLRHDFKWPRELDKVLPAPFKEAISQALQRNPDKRTASVWEMLRGLKAGLKERPMSQTAAAPTARVFPFDATRLGPRRRDARAERPRVEEPVLGRAMLTTAAGRQLVVKVHSISPHSLTFSGRLDGSPFVPGHMVQMSFPRTREQGEIELACGVVGARRTDAPGLVRLVIVDAPPRAFSALLERWNA